MEEPHNQTSAYDYTEPTFFYYDPFYYDVSDHSYPYSIIQDFQTILLIVHCLIFSVALPLICVAFHGLHSVVKTNHVVYVINLFISDLIQVFAKLILSVTRQMHVYEVDLPMMLVYIFGVGLNVCFMVCISAERYTMIAHTVWYRNMLRLRISVFVSVAVWILILISCVILSTISNDNLSIVVLVGMLLPYPLVVSFFVGTWRALSRTSVPHNDQRQIMATLALVLCVYTISFLPHIVIIILSRFPYVYTDPVSQHKWEHSSEILIALNPLFDFLLYVFMRKDAKDIFSALFSCFYKRHEANTVQTYVTEAQV
ncbi:ovarian cancer G-protein coupled receptor 1-like [Clupea harengus]|uniref:Ovarian cancer G-protein coupled receptor 1-like n=1 Tax=Clupea harengus TaxID=7950 RepID=A0A6P8GJG4_CLUHA|nr:ovarian cancer G-protein coupled receptor 1-like [Clupea harengus]XP_031435046.1 ovarian cancer G-protein coupled receptor 1-like [Clupea harengus]